MVGQLEVKPVLTGSADEDGGMRMVEDGRSGRDPL